MMRELKRVHNILDRDTSAIHNALGKNTVNEVHPLKAMTREEEVRLASLQRYEPLWEAWHIDSLIDKGTFGEVYRAHREDFGKIYYSAVKVISVPRDEAEIRQMRNDGYDDVAQYNFFRALLQDLVSEIDLLTELRGNSHIVNFDDYKIIDRATLPKSHIPIGWDLLIRMELLTNVADYAMQYPLSVAEVVKLGIHICKALELCAQKKIIHRDIKPDNILISQYGDYKLGDFGIARQLERTMSGLSKKGTYSYMAPEVFRGEPYGFNVDTYSLGIVLYRFLNQNRNPFLPDYPETILPNDREKALQRRISGERMPDLKRIRPNLNALVLKACAFDRRDRFSSPAEMREALETIEREIKKNPATAIGQTTAETSARGIGNMAADRAIQSRTGSMPANRAIHNGTNSRAADRAKHRGTAKVSGIISGNRWKLALPGVVLALVLVIVLGIYFLRGNNAGIAQTEPPTQSDAQDPSDSQGSQAPPEIDPTLLIPGPAGTDLPMSVQIKNANWLTAYGRAVWTADGSVQVISVADGTWTNIGSLAPGAVSASVLSPVSGTEIAEVLDLTGESGYYCFPVMTSDGQWRLEIRAADASTVLASAPWVPGQRISVGYADGTVFFASGSLAWSAAMSDAYQVDICFQTGATQIRDVQIGQWPLPAFSPLSDD